MVGADRPWDWKKVNGPLGVAVPEQMVVRGVVGLAAGTVFLALSVFGFFGGASWLGVFLSVVSFFLGGIGVFGGIILHRRGDQTS